MAWTKDTVSLSPKIVYTSDNTPQVARIIIDPNAPAGQRVVAELNFLIFDGEAQADIDGAFGVS